MDLIFNKTNFDFWKFYTDNKESIDTILWSFCWKYKNIYDPDDMHSELLLYLAQCHLFEDFDPTKAKLNTYITIRIRAQAAYIALKEKKTRHFKIYDEDHEEEEIDCKKLYEGTYNSQYLNPEINRIKNNIHRKTPKELQVNVDFDGNLIREELLSLMDSKLTPHNKDILSLIKTGINASEIAKIFQFTPQYIYTCIHDIKKIFVKICCREGFIFNKKRENSNV